MISVVFRSKPGPRAQWRQLSSGDREDATNRERQTDHVSQDEGGLLPSFIRYVEPFHHNTFQLLHFRVR